MPTIHISLPSSLYEELKREAEEYGMQITDLVKMFIKQGIEKNMSRRIKSAQVDERVEVLEGELHVIKELIDELFKRLDEIEDALEEIRSPTVEPEIVEPPPSRGRA